MPTFTRIMVCKDCLMAIANDDYTGLDYYYGPDEAVQRMCDIERGIETAGGWIVVGDPENDDDFSRSPCECCNSPLAGARHECFVDDRAATREG